MEDLSNILSILTNFDIQAETLAAALLTQNDESNRQLSMERVVVSPVGHAKRRSMREVKKVSKKYYAHDTVLFIEVNRKGLLDTLPINLFLNLEKDYENTREKSRDIERQIKDARKFFLPFEQAMYHPRIEAEQMEQRWTETFPDFIQEIWGLPEFADCLDDRQRFLLCYILPESYRVVGNWELTGLCFEAVMRKPIDLNFVVPQELSIPGADRPASEMELGRDTIIGETFLDDMPALEVCVKGILSDEISDYLPGGKKRRILEELLYSYFLPLDVFVITRIMVTDDTWDFTLGDSILGYNVRL